MRPGHIAIAALFLLVPILVSVATGVWLPTALPAGVLLGFFLAKGDLCSASAFAEIILMRDGRKLAGLLTAAITAMVIFAVGDALGVIDLVPRPLAWASYLVGGAVFGVGMVLAGGCVSGSLYKAGLGHASSLIALGFIAVGMHVVDFGPLNTLHASLMESVVAGPDGAPVTFSTLTGVSVPWLAALFGAVAIVVGIRRSRRRPVPSGAVRRPPTGSALHRILRHPWPAWVAGLAVGLLALPAWLSSLASGRDFPLCVSYGVEELPLPLLAADVEYIWRAGGAAAVPGGADPRVYVWLVIFAPAVVLGAYFAGRLVGAPRFYPRPRGQLLAAAIGGLLVGIGAALARGCILGNGVMGLAMMSVGMVLFAVTAMLANWITTRVWVMGR